jgi:hypothetical protein
MQLNAQPQLNVQARIYQFSGNPTKITSGTVTSQEIECYLIGYDSVANKAYGFNIAKEKLLVYDTKNLKLSQVAALSFKDNGEKRKFQLVFMNNEGKVFFITSKIKKSIETLYAQELDKESLTLKPSFKIFEGEVFDKESSSPIFSLSPDRSALLCRTDYSEDFVVLDRNLQLSWKQAVPPAKKHCKIFRLVNQQQVIIPPCNTIGSVSSEGDMIFHVCTSQKVREIKTGIDGALGYENVYFHASEDEIFIEGAVVFKKPTSIFKFNGEYGVFSGFIRDGKAKLHVKKVEANKGESNYITQRRKFLKYPMSAPIGMYLLPNGKYIFLWEEYQVVVQSVGLLKAEGLIALKTYSEDGKFDDIQYLDDRFFDCPEDSPYASIKVIEDQEEQLYLIYSVIDDISNKAPQYVDNTAKIQLVRLDENGKPAQTTILWARKDHKQKAPIFDRMLKISASEAITINENGEIFKITF